MQELAANVAHACGQEDDDEQCYWALARIGRSEALAAGYGAIFGHTGIKGVQQGPLEGYSQQLACSEGMRPGESVHLILERRLLQVVQWQQSESTTKAVLPTVRLVEKMEWATPTSQPSDCYWCWQSNNSTPKRNGRRRRSGHKSAIACTYAPKWSQWPNWRLWCSTASLSHIA